MADQDKQQGLSTSELQTLLMTSQAMSQEQNEERICHWVCDVATSFLGASLASIIMAPAKEDLPATVYGKLADSPLPELVAREMAELARGERPDSRIAGRVATLQKSKLPSVLTQQGINHLVRVDVRTIQQEIGVLLVGREGPWELDSRVRFVLATLANEAALTLENVRLRREATEQAQTLRALIQASPLGIIAHDGDAKVQMWNPAAERIFGWSEQEVLGRPYPLVPEEKLGEFQMNLERTLRGEALTGLETLRQRKDGAQVDVSIWTGPLGDGGAMVVIDDITERKKAEVALRESEEQVRSLLNSTGEAIYGVDLQGNCTFCNPACLRLLGYADSELLGKNMHNLIHHTLPNGNPYPEEECRIYQAFRGEQGTHVDDEVLWRADKTNFPAEYWSYPVHRENKLVGCVVTFVDITERQQAQETLRESEEKFRKIFDNSNDAIILIDPERDKILDVNPKACDMLGFSHQELTSLSISAIHPGEMPELRAFAQSVLETGQGWTSELTCRTKTGEVLQAEISASTVEIGGETRLISLVRDTTERKRTEETLLQQMRELAIVEERNRLAREIHDTLAQGLTAILWQLNAAERAVEAGGQEALEYLERVRNLAREGLQEARRSVWDLRAGPLEGRTLVEALQGEMEKVATAGDIETSFVLSGAERVLPAGAEAALLRICQESLANMLKHASASQATVTLAFDDSQVRLAVQDNGIGFDPEIPATRAPDSGGFGLINMRERARLLGGELTVQSEPGRGTIVEATLSL